MKIEVDDLDGIYNSCRISGRFKEKIPDLELIKYTFHLIMVHITTTGKVKLHDDIKSAMF